MPRRAEKYRAWLPPGWLSTVALAGACTLVATSFAATPFRAYFGALPPLAGMALSAALAWICLAALLRGKWIARGAPAGRPVLLAPVVGMGFAAVTVAVDIAAPWPAGINVPLPQGVFFYAAIALTAETVFHLLPLTLLLLAARRLRPGADLFWPAALVAALTEPAFQIVLGHDPAVPLWRDGFLAVNLAGLALAQFALLRRFGIWGAFGARLGYYAIWHLAWGSARLPLLFAAG